MPDRGAAVQHTSAAVPVTASGPDASAEGGFISFRDYVADPSNHAPRPAPAAPAHRDVANAEHLPAPSVIDPATGKVRVMEARCTTCIGRRGNPAQLTPERLEDLLGRCGDGTYDEGHTVCHSTLPGNPDDLPASVCAWIAQHPQAGPRSLVMRLAASAGTIPVRQPARPAGK